MNDYESTEVNAINYLKIFFRRKEILIISAFAGLVIGLSTAFLLPKQYQSSSIILVQEGKSDNPLFSQLAVSTTVRERMAGIKESILGWNSMVELVKRLNLDTDVKSALEFEELIMEMRKNILIRLRGHNIIHLAYIGKIPEQTQAVVKTITDIFIDRNVEIQNQETADAIAFIKEQLHVYKGKIKSAEIADLQDKLNTLLIDSTEKHPLVKQYRELIAIRKEELRRENLEYTENADLKPQTTNPIIEEIKKALSGLETGVPDQKDKEDDGDLYKAMLMANLENVAARDVRVNETIYNTLLQRLETAQITQRLQSSKEGTRYTILDPPRVPLKPIKPNKVVVALIGLFFGAIVGIGLIFGLEFLDKSFIDVEEAKEYLGVPLLGAISKINTIENIHTAKAKMRWMYFITLIGGIILLLVSYIIAGIIK